MRFADLEPCVIQPGLPFVHQKQHRIEAISMRCCFGLSIIGSSQVFRVKQMSDLIQ